MPWLASARLAGPGPDFVHVEVGLLHGGEMSAPGHLAPPDDVVGPLGPAARRGGVEGLAREVGDYGAEQFMQWFVKEQVEEVALMGDLLKAVERSKDNLLLVEEYISREGLGEEGEDPTAPPAAGGG